MLKPRSKPKELSHKKLVEIARKWLSRKCPVVTTELVSSISESCDVIGWHRGLSYMIEVKASKSDFYADKKKFFRKFGKYGVGNYRYYLAPKDLIKSDSIPDDWGLLEVLPNKSVSIRKAPSLIREINHPGEKIYLTSLICRISSSAHKFSGVGIRCYHGEEGSDNTNTSLTVTEQE